MHARRSRLEGPPVRIDGMARRFEEVVVPLLRELDGVPGAMVLADRSRGTDIAISYGESVAAMLAPADWYSSSEKWERSPAPARISTFAPCLTSFFAVSGLIPMRGSSELSAGTPIVIIVAPSASSTPGHASTHAIGIEWVGRQDHAALRAG